MIVKGRGIKSPIGNINVNRDEKSAVIRIDDDANPEFWMEIILTRDEVDAIFDQFNWVPEVDD